MSKVRLVNELAPSVERLMNRHLETTKEWFPHELVPWSKGRDFTQEDPWNPDEVNLSPGVKSALFVNLLTEDNLPYYFNALATTFGEGIWGEWARRWTAEEHRHSIVIRDYLTVTRLLDPVALERARMNQVSGGAVPEPVNPTETLVYVTLQELATRVSHRNTGKLIGDPAGYAIMARVGADENLHHLFYRDLTTDAIALDPSATMIAIEKQVRTFAMPGLGIDDFDTHAALIAKEGIYDLPLHYDVVLNPVLMRQWKVDKVEGLSGEAEEAREKLMKFLGRLKKAAARITDRRGEVASVEEKL